MNEFYQAYRHPECHIKWNFLKFRMGIEKRDDFPFTRTIFSFEKKKKVLLCKCVWYID